MKIVCMRLFMNPARGVKIEGKGESANLLDRSIEEAGIVAFYKKLMDGIWHSESDRICFQCDN